MATKVQTKVARGEEKQTVTLDVDPTIWKRLKHMAVEEGVTVRALVDMALRSFLGVK